MSLFVAGIHAVGKTFGLKPVCESLGLRHATASQLIKEQQGVGNWTMSREVGAIDANQRALVASVQRLQQGGQTIVLDGHFVLRRAVGVHEKIGVDTFSQLAIQGVILLEEATETIAERLMRRGDDTWDRAEIKVFAKLESEHAEFVCSELAIPLVRLSAPTEAALRETVLGLLG
nr:ATP-binding protein [uncultured Cupriavidus sp.]